MAAVSTTPDRPVAGSRSSQGVGRQVDYWSTVYKRTWKGSVDLAPSSSPLFYVLAMGVLLGGFVDADPAQLDGATSYLASSCPGLIAAQAMQTAVGETTYPVMGAIKWQRVFYAQLATPLAVPRPGQRACCCSCSFRVGRDLRRLLPGDGAVRRLRDAGGGRSLALAGDDAGRHGVRDLDLRLQRPRAESEESFGLIFRLGADPAVPVLRRVLPDQQPRHGRRVGRPAARRCGTAST